MEIVYSAEDLADYLVRTAVPGSSGRREIFLDRFLEHAIEVDVDALCDGEDVWIGGIMQHVEEAGIHSGDSACVLPPHSLGPDLVDQIREWTRGIALELGVVGLLNIQFAATFTGPPTDDGTRPHRLYVIEANPRASRTVPFVSKATGVPLAKMAARLMLGESIADLHLPADPMAGAHVSRQGGRPPVRPLPGLGLPARPGDALDRRGDGRRGRLPDGLRQGPGRGRVVAAVERERSSSR